MAPKVSRRPASLQPVLDLFNVHVGAQQLASARAKPGHWFDCTTDNERYGFLADYERLVHAIIDLGPYVLKSTLNEVLLHLNLWQDGRLSGKDVEQWGSCSGFPLREPASPQQKGGLSVY